MQAVLLGTDTKTQRNITLTPDERPLGTVLIGQTGYGKTSLMEHLIEQDIRDQTTCILFDPHGELSERILRISAGINPDNLLFCEIAGNLSYGFNPLEIENPGDPLEESQTIDSLMQVFRKHWSDNPAYAFGSRVEWVLSNTARTILANPGYTLAEIPLLLSDKAFRDKLVRNVVNPQVQFFWGEYRQLESTRRPLDTWQMVESTITRLTQFLANEWLYRVLYQAKGTIKFHQLIDSGKTIIFTLPIGKLGEEPASLLGSLLLGKLATTIFSRNEYGKEYPRAHVYIDEYARFSIPMISQLWVQARKFNCGLTTTIQSFSQIKDEESRAALLQAGTLLAFQCIGSDAQIIASQMPLPDPVSLMKPEPILVYSHTAVEDIWHKGHPNGGVQAVREVYFRIVDDLEKKPHEEYFIYDPAPLLREHPAWGKPALRVPWDSYRSSADMLKEGISLLDQYYYDWMQHLYGLYQPATEQDVDLVIRISDCLFGYFGWRGTMQPYMTRERQDYLYHRLQDHINSIEDRYYHRRDVSYQSPAIADYDKIDWRYVGIRKRYEDLVYSLSVHHFSDSIPDPEIILNAAREIGIPEYEIDKLIAWKRINMDDLLNSVPSGNPQRTTIREMLNSLWKPILEAIPAAPATEHERRLRELADETPGFAEQFEFAVWQGKQQSLFIQVGMRLCGSLLEKEPVFDTSHVYKDVEYNRRTYSDLREELVNRLVSLPKFHIISPLTDGSIVQIKTVPPLEIAGGQLAEEQARQVRSRCQKELGHPWQEVVKDIQDRQNLPPSLPKL